MKLSQHINIHNTQLQHETTQSKENTSKSSGVSCGLAQRK